MYNLTEEEIKYLRDCVLSSTLLGHEVAMGSNVLRKLDKALTIPAVVGRSEQFYCSSWEDGEWRCETQCLGCAGLEEQAKQ